MVLATDQFSVDNYQYDAKGNPSTGLGQRMITRVEGGLTYTQVFDAENRLAYVAVSGQTTQFIYDGDGNLVKKIQPDGTCTIYIGGVYEVEKSTCGGTVTHTTTYYPAAGAMRVDDTLYYVLKDHLGSASVVTDASGNIVGEQRYYPFGETRIATGAIPTDKLYTGQRDMTGLGIYHYGARFYSPKLGRFLSADTIVPGYANPQNLNRYSYVGNSPLNYTDPSGHVRIQEGSQNDHFSSHTHNQYTPKPPKPPNDDNGGGDGESNNEDSGNSMYHLEFDTNLYLLGWQHFGSAWSIYSNPNATISQRAGAVFYMGAWGGAHAGILAGGTILAWEAVVPGSMSCIGNPACQQQAQRTITNTQITGRIGQPINLQGSSPATINGLSYSGHAIDRMLGNGIPPSAIQNVVQNYAPGSGNLPNTLAYFDPVNSIRVITNATTQIIITLGYGPPK